MLAVLAALAVLVAPDLPLPRGPVDFAPALAALRRDVACAGAAVDVHADLAATDRGAVIARHCTALGDHLAAHRARWLEPARAFFRALVPADAPRVVVYPFGGADALTALTVFPEAREVTVLGLEEGGDPRALAGLSTPDLEVDLEVFRQTFDHLLDWSWSRTIDLDLAKAEPLPMELALDVAGLVVAGFEPISLRYFELGADGAITYLDAPGLSDIDAELAALRLPRRPAAGSSATLARAAARRFASFELGFRPRGEPTAELRVFRHVHAYLDDPHLAKDARALRHLERKGAVSVLVKAASYLLWWNNFERVRGYVVGHLAWMVSDETGVPPRLLDPDRFVAEPWGHFDRTFIPSSSPSAEASVRALFASRPERPLPFPFGYPSADGGAHLVVTRRR